MWMYNEGVYLYRIIKSRVLRINSINLRMYMFGWGLPALMTSVWLLVTMVYYKKSSSVCWWGYSLLPFFWILEGPRIIIMIVSSDLINCFQCTIHSIYTLQLKVNFIILIIVLRELLKKIKSKITPSNELDIIRYKKISVHNNYYYKFNILNTTSQFPNIFTIYKCLYYKIRTPPQKIDTF